MYKDYYVRRNGQWISLNTGKPFSGIVRSGNLYFNLTKDGRKILLSKPKPDPQRIVANLWQFENPQRRGFVNGLYYPFVTANGNTDIGAGIDMSKQTAAFRKEAQRGLTPQRMNQELYKRANEHLRKVDSALRRYTNYPDTVSPQIKEGLADIRYQVGSLGGFPKLLRAVAKGDLNEMRQESRVMYRNNNTGKMEYDKRRHEARCRGFFHYGQGGFVGMASPLMESIIPCVPYKGFAPEQMQREQTRRAAQEIQQKAIEPYTNVKKQYFRKPCEVKFFASLV